MHRTDQPRWALPVNVLLYQVGWFACVLGAARGVPWTGPAVAAGLVTVHLLLTDRPAAEGRLMLAAVALGVVVDGSLAAAGMVRYPDGLPAPFLPPLWMLCLWPLFAALLPHALAWLRGRFLLGALLGAGGGPLAYLGGERLGAIDLPGGALPAAPLAALALAWAVAIPLLLALEGRLVPGRPAGAAYRPIGRSSRSSSPL
ncbi:MAG: DUF2878 domain-containing protein [Acidobacteriota bacterium]|jgi:hypothetical protein